MEEDGNELGAANDPEEEGDDSVDKEEARDRFELGRIM